MTATQADVALWLAVVVSGLYHGINPAMGWPLAFAAGLKERRAAALFKALVPLATGHLAAMAVVLLPFAMLTMLVRYSRDIQIAAAVLVVAFGIYLWLDRRHAHAAPRISSAQLAWWSFTIAIAHGAGLMLVPIYLGICTTKEMTDMGHEAAASLMVNNIAMACAVSAVHALAMVAAGGAMAWIVYRFARLKALSKTWLNLDAFWPVSLIIVGMAALIIALG